jgi:hypothetical protein
MPGAARTLVLVSSDEHSGTMQTVAAQRIASLLVLGFGLCEEAHVPLSERQRIALLTAALLEFDGVRAEIEGLLQIERLLSEFRIDGPPNGHEYLA